MDNGQYERLLAEIGESRLHTDERFTESLRHTDERFGEAKLHTDERFTELRRHTDECFAESLRHTDECFAESLRHTDECFAEAKREFHVFAEASRSAIQQVAEGVATLDAKLDRLGAELRADSAETRSLLRLAFTNLDRRVTRLEGGLHPG